MKRRAVKEEKKETRGGDMREDVVNKFPRGEQRTDEVENASWLWDPSRAQLGLETVSRTTEKETDESGASENSYCRAHTHIHTHTFVILSYTAFRHALDSPVNVPPGEVLV